MHHTKGLNSPSRGGLMNVSVPLVSLRPLRKEFCKCRSGESRLPRDKNPGLPLRLSKLHPAPE